MGSFSFLHWMVVLGVVLLFAGPRKIPELAKALGMGIREFKRGIKGDEADESDGTEVSPRLTDPDLVPFEENVSSFHKKAKLR